MKVSAFLRKIAKKNDTDSQATIYFRLRDKNKDFKSASELVINPNHWSQEKQGYKDRVALISDDEKMKLKNDIQNIVSVITQNYSEDANAEWLSEQIDKYHHPDKYKTQGSLVGSFNLYSLLKLASIAHSADDTNIPDLTGKYSAKLLGEYKWIPLE